MPILKRNFIAGKMNKDADERLLPPGEYRDGVNIRIANTEGSDVGAIENVLSNQQLTSIDLGTNAKCIGAMGDNFQDKIYWFTVSDTSSHILEYDVINSVASIVLKDSRVGDANVLGFNSDMLITAFGIIVDTDNDSRYLTYSDDNKQPRFLNIERAKGFAENGFEEEDIALMKKAPLDSPTIVLSNTASDQENNLEKRFLQFATRYKYLDGEYSAISPLSEVAFFPENFQFDYSISSNESMINNFSLANVSFNTGDQRVVEVDLLFKENGSNNLKIVESFNKNAKGWSDNSTVTEQFSNNKEYISLDQAQLFRIFDAVPLKAKALEVLGNQIFLGNTLDNYDIADSNGDDISINFQCNVVSTPIVEGTPQKSLKSNRDYEIGISYLDSFGRMTTPLTSEGNTFNIQNSDCVNQNQAQVQVNSIPPAFATHYRFFIKQSRIDYDVIAPVIFYSDGVYVWIRIEGDDQDKINQGDFLYVKSDSSSVLQKVVETKVLEIKEQSRNFLETDEAVINGTETLQLSGFYFRIKANGFSLNTNGASIYDSESYGFRSDETSNNFSNSQDYIEDPVYYGSLGLNDLSQSGTYTADFDKRFEIEVFSEGAPDTFRWRAFDATNGTETAWEDNSGSGVAMTGAAQALSDGVEITFTATSGHTAGDRWIVSAKSADVTNSTNNGASGELGRRAIVSYKGKAVSDETIRGGATITIRYDDSGSDSGNVSEKYGAFEQTFITSQEYANLEEWFFGDNIISQLNYPTAYNRVIFRRGTQVNQTPPEAVSIDPAGDMIMCFMSSAVYSDGSNNRIRVNASINITELQNNIIFETIPTKIDEDIFYEIGKTYEISGGYHLGDATDQDQNASQPAILTLDIFNCFSWGNGFESYKIKDSLNGNRLLMDARPSTPIEDYRANRRIGRITYSGVFEQSTNFNALNEFNASTVNFIDLDDAYGSIQKLYNRNDILIAFQEDKTTPIGYRRTFLFDENGNPSLIKSEQVLNPLQPYAGVRGIGTNPESFAVEGNRIYHTDEDRGAVMRLSADGYEEISRYGMRTYFRNQMKNNKGSVKLGGYDYHNDQYTLNIGTSPSSQTVVGCGTVLSKFNESSPFAYTLNLNEALGDVTISYNITSGSANIVANYDGVDVTENGATGTGNIVVDRNNANVSQVTITVTPVAGSIDYEISHACPVVSTQKVVLILVNDAADAGQTITARYSWDSSPFYSEIKPFDADGVTLFEEYEGSIGFGRIPSDGATITLQAYQDSGNDGEFDIDRQNKIGYLISNTVYTDADYAAIEAAATFPAPTVTNEGGIPETNEISFTFTKVNQDDILYLIIDCSEPPVVANDDSIDIFNGATETINVMFNDTIIGSSALITIVTPPVNGTAIISGNQVRYTHNGGQEISDSLVYQLDNLVTQDTATLSINIINDPRPGGGGGGSSQGLGFAISTQGYDSGGSSDGQGACEFVLDGTKYHDGESSYPTLADTIYNDIDKNTVFDGQNFYWAITNGRSIQIDSNGVVQDLWICGQGGGGGSA